jgi:hypothetical protein
VSDYGFDDPVICANCLRLTYRPHIVHWWRVVCDRCYQEWLGSIWRQVGKR